GPESDPSTAPPLPRPKGDEEGGEEEEYAQGDAPTAAPWPGPEDSGEVKDKEETAEPFLGPQEPDNEEEEDQQTPAWREPTLAPSTYHSSGASREETNAPVKRPHHHDHSD
ncbi:unnamed protein product, partial [Discosporangium mesarthrocarpum]